MFSKYTNTMGNNSIIKINYKYETNFNFYERFTY